MARKPVAVMYADGHLADRAWSWRPIEGDSYHSLHQIITAARKREVPVIGAGDLIDKHRNTARPIHMLHRELDRLADKGLEFFFVQGQHEFDDVPWFSANSQACHIHKKTIDVGPFKVYGLDYQPAGRLQQELDQIPADTDILVAHQVWDLFMGDIAAPQGGIHDVPVVSTVFTGDFHEFKEVDTRGKDGQEVHVVSPGSVCMQSIDEPPKKYFLILHDDGTFERRRLNTRPMLDASMLLTQDNMDHFAETIQGELEKMTEEAAGFKMPEEVCKPLLRVTYSYRLKDVKRRVMNLVGERAHIFWKELPPEKPEAQERRKKRVVGQKHATTLDTKLGPYLEATDQKRLLGPCQRLLQANDVGAELQRMRAEALGEG